MKPPFYHHALERAHAHANDFLEGLEVTPVGATAAYAELKALWDWNLPTEGMAAEDVIEELNRAARPGLNHNQSGRFFAWVIGGSHPAAMAADWLTTVWDQNAGLYAVSPSGAIVEEIAGGWLKQLLRIPDKASFAFVTGCQMANFTCLNVARNYLLKQANWDFKINGLSGAPPIRIICGDAKHNTIVRALGMLGFGSAQIVNLPTDEKASLQFDAVRKEFERDPDILTMIVLQAGEIHTGAFDDFESIIPLAQKYKAWVHIDGAFGLWANATKKYAYLLTGASAADSWATDGHKWLNVPYDSGFAFVAHPDVHFESLNSRAGYLAEDDVARDQFNWNPELSRRARGFATYAAIKELGTLGIEDLVERCCTHAATIVEAFRDCKHIEVLANPIINQGVIRFVHPLAPDDEFRNDRFTEEVITEINASGEAFFQPSTFKGKRCMRISVSGWRTTHTDVKRTIQAIREALEKRCHLALSS